MPIGHLTLWTGGASLATLFTSMDHWSLGLRWSKNQLHCCLLKLNIMRCLMLLKKHFGFTLSLASYIFQSHVLFLSSVIIKRPVPSQIHLPFRLALNTLTSDIILWSYSGWLFYYYMGIDRRYASGYLYKNTSFYCFFSSSWCFGSFYSFIDFIILFSLFPSVTSSNNQTSCQQTLSSSVA